MNCEKTIEGGLYAIAEGLESVADAIVKLGLNGACNPDTGLSMGAIEVLSLEVRNGTQLLATAIAEAAEQAKP